MTTQVIYATYLGIVKDRYKGFTIINSEWRKDLQAYKITITDEKQ